MGKRIRIKERNAYSDKNERVRSKKNLSCFVEQKNQVKNYVPTVRVYTQAISYAYIRTHN